MPGVGTRGECRYLPGQLHVASDSALEDEVKWPVPTNLIGDMRAIVSLGVLSVGRPTTAISLSLLSDRRHVSDRQARKQRRVTTLNEL